MIIEHMLTSLTLNSVRGSLAFILAGAQLQFKQ